MTGSPSKNHHHLPTRNRLEKHYLLGVLEKMFWCWPGCACTAGTSTLILFSKGALAHGAGLCRATPQGNLCLEHLHACFCSFWSSLIRQDQNSLLHLPSGNVVPPIPFLQLRQSYHFLSLLENQARIEIVLGQNNDCESVYCVYTTLGK